MKSQKSSIMKRTTTKIKLTMNSSKAQNGKTIIKTGDRETCSMKAINQHMDKEQIIKTGDRETCRMKNINQHMDKEQCFFFCVLNTCALYCHYNNLCGVSL
uniref:Uncharacterized protein n=1 Tax=Cacopsylla melanoneura TaxID=428564 RepID=A0A8D8Q3S3_9HEMI